MVDWSTPTSGALTASVRNFTISGKVDAKEGYHRCQWPRRQRLLLWFIGLWIAGVVMVSAKGIVIRPFLVK